MAYKIVIGIDEKDVRPDDVKSITNYIAESVERAGLSYTVDCFKDGMKVMMRLKEPQADSK
ncbi:MAG TPA: hypothetical protein VFZ05_02610 [Nitrososphaera sp.]